MGQGGYGKSGLFWWPGGDGGGGRDRVKRADLRYASWESNRQDWKRAGDGGWGERRGESRGAGATPRKAAVLPFP